MVPTTSERNLISYRKDYIAHTRELKFNCEGFRAGTYHAGATTGQCALASRLFFAPRFIEFVKPVKLVSHLRRSERISSQLFLFWIYHSKFRLNNLNISTNSAFFLLLPNDFRFWTLVNRHSKARRGKILLASEIWTKKSCLINLFKIKSVTDGPFFRCRDERIQQIILQHCL